MKYANRKSNNEMKNYMYFVADSGASAGPELAGEDGHHHIIRHNRQRYVRSHADLQPFGCHRQRNRSD